MFLLAETFTSRSGVNSSLNTHNLYLLLEIIIATGHLLRLKNANFDT